MVRYGTVVLLFALGLLSKNMLVTQDPDERKSTHLRQGDFMREDFRTASTPGFRLSNHMQTLSSQYRQPLS